MRYMFTSGWWEVFWFGAIPLGILYALMFAYLMKKAYGKDK
jgi:hypothetical protein